MRKVFVIAFSTLSVCLNPVIHADTIILNDGKKLEGVITEEGSDYYKIKVKIVTIKLNKDTVKEVKKLSAEENLLNLGNQYLASKNLDAALEQYERALQANADYQPAKEAISKIKKSKEEEEAKKRAALGPKEKETLEKGEKINSELGVTIGSSEGRIIIVSVAAGSNAEDAGIKGKDEIRQINELDAKGKSPDEINDYLAKSEISAYTFLIQRECELMRKKIDYQKNSFVGVGLFLDTSGNDLVISSIIVGEPADLAGLKSKDRVISIDGKPVSGISVDDAALLTGGPESSKLKIVIQRPVVLERKAPAAPSEPR